MRGNSHAHSEKRADEVRLRLVEVGGATSQEFGMGRNLGRIMVYLYLSTEPRPLDKIEEALGLSKASVSTAARQLESLGLLQRVWKRGDRRVYYCTAANIGEALQHGLLALAKRKVELVSSELEAVRDLLDASADEETSCPECTFLSGRVRRARELAHRATQIINSPLLRLLR